CAACSPASGVGGEALKPSAPCGSNAAGLSLRPRRAIDQTGLTFSQIPAQPFVGGRWIHGFTPAARAAPALLSPWSEHCSDQFQSMYEGQSGIPVHVHSAELLKDANWVAPFSL